MEEKTSALHGFVQIQEKELRMAASMNKNLGFQLLDVDGAGYALCTGGAESITRFVLVAHASKRPRLFRSLNTCVELIKSFNPEICNITINLDPKKEPANEAIS